MCKSLKSFFKTKEKKKNVKKYKFYGIIFKITGFFIVSDIAQQMAPERWLRMYYEKRIQREIRLKIQNSGFFNERKKFFCW